jgi:hypothetical protein
VGGRRGRGRRLELAEEAVKESTSREEVTTIPYLLSVPAQQHSTGPAAQFFHFSFLFSFLPCIIELYFYIFLFLHITKDVVSHFVFTG